MVACSGGRGASAGCRRDMPCGGRAQRAVLGKAGLLAHGISLLPPPGPDAGGDEGASPAFGHGAHAGLVSCHACRESRSFSVFCSQSSSAWDVALAMVRTRIGKVAQEGEQREPAVLVGDEGILRRAQPLQQLPPPLVGQGEHVPRRGCRAGLGPRLRRTRPAASGVGTRCSRRRLGTGSRGQHIGLQPRQRAGLLVRLAALGLRDTGHHPRVDRRRGRGGRPCRRRSGIASRLEAAAAH